MGEHFQKNVYYCKNGRQDARAAHQKSRQKADHIGVPDLKQNGLVFKSPSRIAYVGGTGSGKTNCLLACLGHGAQWKAWKHIFLLSPNVESTIKGEYGILDDVIPLTEWPAINYFDKYPGRKVPIADDNALVGLPTRGGTDSQRNRADRICGHVSTHKNLTICICQQTMVGIPPNIYSPTHVAFRAVSQPDFSREHPADRTLLHAGT